MDEKRPRSEFSMDAQEFYPGDRVGLNFGSTRMQSLQGKIVDKIVDPNTPSWHGGDPKNYPYAIKGRTYLYKIQWDDADEGTSGCQNSSSIKLIEPGK